MFFPPSLIPRANKKAQDRTKRADLRFETSLEHADKAPGTKTGAQRAASHDSKDGMMRVYIAILLLLLFIDRFTSLHGVPCNFMVVKEPTYKI